MNPDMTTFENEEFDNSRVSPEFYLDDMTMANLAKFYWINAQVGYVGIAGAILDFGQEKFGTLEFIEAIVDSK